jgi:hypothetical protein
VFGREHLEPLMLAPCSLAASGENLMNAWSDYLRGQAVIADRHSKAMTAAETIKEFADIAESFRQDADAEDKNPTCKH